MLSSMLEAQRYREVLRQLGGIMQDKCDKCDTEPTDITLTWNSELGWHGLCNNCKLVPALTQAGRLAFIRVGDN